MAEKNVKMLNEALDLLDEVCMKVNTDGITHARMRAAAGLLRAEINKKEEVKEDDKT